MPVTVKVANRVYQMPKTKAEGLLKLASEKVPRGIYAIGKGDYLELHNQPMSRTRMKEARRSYAAQGYKVYCNGL